MEFKVWVRISGFRFLDLEFGISGSGPGVEFKVCDYILGLEEDKILGGLD